MTISVITSTPDLRVHGKPLDVFEDDPSALPPDAVIDGAEARDDIVDIADYVVVGSGASGATAALTLARTGARVIIVEEGAYTRTRQFTPDLLPAMQTLLRDGGSNLTVGRAAILLLQGRGVGGSTTVNSGIAWRAPDAVLATWQRRFGLGDVLSPRALEPHFDALERELHVRPVGDDALGEHNRRFGEAAEQIGIRAERTRRFDRGCDGTAGCLTGCMRAKKGGMNVTFIPAALRLGAVCYTNATVRRIETRGDLAVGVTATLGGDRKHRLRVHARRGVLLCASAVQTPNILRRSGIRAHAVGRHFQCHLGANIAARFRDSIDMHRGATQGCDSMHFSEWWGFKLETLSLPPELMPMSIPGFGPSLVRALADYGHLSSWAVALRSSAEGRVTSVFGSDTVLFTPSTNDMARMRKGLSVLTQMLFAAGAIDVWPNVHGMPERLVRPEQAALFDDAPLDPRAYRLITSHLFGTARMGPESRSSVVGTRFETHAVRKLFVLDSSVFPTNLGVNPQLTIMAVARRGAEIASER